MHFETDRTNSARTHRVVLTMFGIMILPTAAWVTGEALRAADESPKATTEKSDTTKDASEKATTAEAEESRVLPSRHQFEESSELQSCRRHGNSADSDFLHDKRCE